jgi:hypothetical protein
VILTAQRPFDEVLSDDRISIRRFCTERLSLWFVVLAFEARKSEMIFLKRSSRSDLLTVEMSSGKRALSSLCKSQQSEVREQRCALRDRADDVLVPQKYQTANHLLPQLRL